jgi:hypothetical protein
MTFHKCSIASPGFLIGKGIQRLSRLPASHDHLCNCVTVGGLRVRRPCALCISHGRATLVRPARIASGEASAHDGHRSVAMLKA